MKDYESILRFINGLEIIDTHEHLPNEADRSKDADVLSEWLIHYFSCDLVSAGLSDKGLAQARDHTKPLRERWALVEPYWNAARSTGYGRALDMAATGIYGCRGITGRTIERLNEAFVAARQKGGHYRRVLKDKSRIAVSIVDSNLNCDREFFVSALRLEEFVIPTHHRDLAAAGARAGVSVHRLEDWEETMRVLLEQAFAKSAVAVKCALAYERPLYFAKPARAQAEEEFNKFFHEEHTPVWRQGSRAGRAFQDYMVHAVLRLADQHAWPVQIHTGIQEGNGNVIADANPTLLSNLFLEYQNVKFDLLHMGYPYVMELGNLAKNFRNVFIDMAWGHIISPEAARRALVEWLDAVPANKICAFGGDYCFVDGVYGHQCLARSNVAAALAQKLADRSFSLPRATEIARWVFVDNPTRIFNLAERVPALAANAKK